MAKKPHPARNAFATLVGERIRQAREQAQETQEDLAKVTGMDRSTIAHYEQGLAHPSLHVALRIAAHYGISLDALVDKASIPHIVQVIPQEIQQLHAAMLTLPQPVADALMTLAETLRQHCGLILPASDQRRPTD